MNDNDTLGGARKRSEFSVVTAGKDVRSSSIRGILRHANENLITFDRNVNYIYLSRANCN